MNNFERSELTSVFKSYFQDVQRKIIEEFQRTMTDSQKQQQEER